MRCAILVGPEPCAAEQTSVHGTSPSADDLVIARVPAPVDPVDGARCDPRSGEACGGAGGSGVDPATGRELADAGHRRLQKCPSGRRSPDRTLPLYRVPHALHDGCRSLPEVRGLGAMGGDETERDPFVRTTTAQDTNRLARSRPRFLQAFPEAMRSVLHVKSSATPRSPIMHLGSRRKEDQVVALAALQGAAYRGTERQLRTAPTALCGPYPERRWSARRSNRIHPSSAIGARGRDPLMLLNQPLQTRDSIDLARPCDVGLPVETPPGMDPPSSDSAIGFSRSCGVSRLVGYADPFRSHAANDPASRARNSRARPFRVVS